MTGEFGINWMPIAPALRVQPRLSGDENQALEGNLST
jgi:hypothetical protein